MILAVDFLRIICDGNMLKIERKYDQKTQFTT